MPHHVTDKEEPMMSAPTRVWAMLFVSGYFAEFWRIIQETGCTHREAWSQCEATLERFKMPPRYDSYESFKTMKSRREAERAEAKKEIDPTGTIYVW